MLYKHVLHAVNIMTSFNICLLRVIYRIYVNIMYVTFSPLKIYLASKLTTLKEIVTTRLYHLQCWNSMEITDF